MKRYQFILNGETIFKNVSPENEDMFFNKYGKYNPTLVSDEPGKSKGTSQSQINQAPSIVKKEDTDYKPVDGSLESLRDSFESLEKDLKENDYESKLKDLKTSIDSVDKDSQADEYNSLATQYNGMLKDYQSKVNMYNNVGEQYNKTLLKNDLDTDKEAARFYEERRQKGFDVIDKSKTPNALQPDWFKSWSMNVADKVLGMVEGTTLTLGAQGKIDEGVMKGKTEQEIIQEAIEGEGDMSIFSGVTLQSIRTVRETLQQFARKEFDPDTGKELQPVDLLDPTNKNYNVAKGAGLAAEQAVSNLYSFIIPAINPFVGAGVIATSVYGQERQAGLRRYKPEELTEEKLKTIKKASFLKAGAEFAGEYLGAKLFRSVSGLRRSGAAEDAVKEYARTLTQRAVRGIGGGFAGEFLAEGLTSLGQDYVDQIYYGDEIDAKKKFRNFINNGLVGGLLGGTLGGGMRAANSQTRDEIIEMLASKEWQMKQYELQEKKLKTEDDIDNTDDQATKDALKKRLDLINKKIAANEKKLKFIYENKTDEELQDDARTLDEINAQRNIAFDNTYDKETRDEAKNIILQLQAKRNQDTEGFVNEDVEYRISEQLTNRQIIERKGGVRGFGRDLKIKYLRTSNDIDKAIKDTGGEITTSDGIFIDGKKKIIYINVNVASQTGQTNVLGHELLHYIMSKNFKTDNASMKPLVDEFKKYLNESEEGRRILNRIENRMKRNGYFDSNGNIKDNFLEEYFEMFSDLVEGNQLPMPSDAAGNSLAKSFSDLLIGLGFKSVKLNGGKDVFEFIRTYSKNVNRKGLLGEITKRRVTKTKLETDIEGVQTADETTAVSKKASRSAKKPVDDLAVDPNTGENYTQEEWDRVGADRAIEEFKVKRKKFKNQGYLDGLIASRYKIKLAYDELKSFVADVLGSREFINMINRFNRGRRGVETGPNKENESLFDYINSQLRFRADDVFKEAERGKVPKDTKTVRADAVTAEGQPLVQVEDTSNNMESFTDEINYFDKQTKETKQEVKQRKSKLRRELGIKVFDKSNIFREVRKALLTSPAITNAKAFLQSFEQTSANALFELMKTKLKDTTDMVKFRLAILESIPIQTLVQMQKMLPEKIFVKNLGRATNKTILSDYVYGRNESGKNPDNKRILPDTILDDSEQSKTKRKQGVPLYERLDVDANTWQEYLEAIQKGKRQTAEKSGTKGNNRIKILEQSAIAIAKDATPEILTDEFIQEYIDTKGLQDQLSVEDVRNEINKTIERPSDLKFSKSDQKAAENLGAEYYYLKDKKSVDKFLDALVRIIGAFDPGFITAGVAITSSTIANKELRKYAKAELAKRVKFVKDKRFARSKIDTKMVRSKSDSQLQAINERNVGNWLYMWKTIFDIVKSDPDLIVPLFHWLKGSQNEGSHPHRIGAALEYIDMAVKGKYYFEHALQNATAYRLLMAAAVNIKTKKQFNKFLEKTKDNYKLIAISAVDNTKIDNAGFKNVMALQIVDGKKVEGNWNVFENSWVERYYNEFVGAIDGGITTNLRQIGSKKTIGEVFNINSDGTSRSIKFSKSLSETRADNNLIEAFNKQAELIRKQNQELQRDLEKRGYKFSKSGDVEGQTPAEMIKIIEEDLKKRGYTLSGTVSSSEFKKIGNWRIDTRTKEGRDFIKEMESIPTVSSSEPSRIRRGMSTFDFDETVGVSENFVIAKKGDDVQRIASNEWPFVGEQLEAEGYEFDFSDFNKVTKGKPGPLFQKMKNQIEKYGSKNVFILTARAPQSEQAIHDWLASNGINIPRENVTGLGNSTGQAKADWMLQKFAEGYNDMYFVDDALPNVEAVRNVLEQLDIKSKVVQAKMKFSKTASYEFNQIIEESQGTKADRVISYQEALKMGRNKNWFRLFVPPSAEDFKGLLYRFLGKGRLGDKHTAWFKKNLLDPFAKGIRQWNIYKQAITEEYKALKKSIPGIRKMLNKKVPDTIFTVDSAVRVYLWNKAGFEIPGITLEAQNKLLEYVNNNPEIKAFADALGRISRVKEGYSQPNQNWSLETIATDLNNIVNKIGRKQFLREYLENVKAIFTPNNMNKIQALYGIEFREALENILYRMENGTNRLQSNDRNVNNFLNWINGSIGAIMFVNMRSSLLQTLSTINFINFSDNNVFKASAAFANQKQYWKDFAMLFNSPQLKQRRAGLAIDVSSSELTKTFAEGGSTYFQKINSVIKYLLQIGFTPTQIADSFAISAGGATFYRNRFKTYKKQGLSDTQANEKAMLDFQEIAEETQQSSREDLISQQQASPLGRLILAFQNVTMQYTRYTKKRLSDLINRRRIPGYTQMQSDMSNVSAILYYGMVQNVIFGALQTALIFVLFGHEEEDEKTDKKIERVANGALDSLLRGTGLYGAIAAAIKNTAMRYKEEREKGWGRDDGRIIVEALQLSPPIGSKVRKIYNALKTEQYNKGVSKEIGARIENPNLVAISNVVEALTNIPLARMVKKANNVEEAVTGNHAMWQRVALFMGWSRWDIGVKDEELEEAKKAVKDKRKREKDKDRVRCTATKKSGGRCKNTTKNSNKRCYAHQ